MIPQDEFQSIYEPTGKTSQKKKQKQTLTSGSKLDPAV